MPRKGFLFVLFSLLFLNVAYVPAAVGGPARYKVLVVMSYHDTVAWEKEIRRGIESVLTDACEVRYFYLDTKYHFSGGAEKAREAFRVYQEFHPDGVISADDDAQSLFVVPYLKDKVKTPVVFCGVNAEPERYGFPAANVTGILERAHFRESIAFLRQLVPTVNSVCYLGIDNGTGRTYSDIVRGEAHSYPAKPVANRLVLTMDEALSASEEMRKKCDALMLTTLEGLKDSAGNYLSEKEIIPSIAKSFGKPVIGINDFTIRSGLLCAVVKSGQEQGATAARMLLKAMGGAPVFEMPITRNREGKRIINVSVMKELGIKPRPVILRGAELVKSEK
jgi:ABC-type uncharacterized transport system substrate-binding protein